MLEVEVDELEKHDVQMIHVNDEIDEIENAVV